jgi:cellulose biosynthesis protein BcsQ
MADVLIPFANGKGGVGKTALACSYAAALAHDGINVLLSDTNEDQRTAETWARVRDHNGLLPKVRVKAMSVREALEQVGRFDAVVVDTPGWTDRGTLALAKKATFLVVPTGPNPTYDLTPTIRLLHGLRAEGIENWRFGVVFSRFQVEAKAREAEEQFARDYLAEAGYAALAGSIPNLPAFSTALAEGYGLGEMTAAVRYLDNVNEVFGAIRKAVSGAERRWQRSGQEGRGRDRGDRER